MWMALKVAPDSNTTHRATLSASAFSDIRSASPAFGAPPAAAPNHNFFGNGGAQSNPPPANPSPVTTNGGGGGLFGGAASSGGSDWAKWPQPSSATNADSNGSKSSVTPAAPINPFTGKPQSE